jgi:hypothetical protein
MDTTTSAVTAQRAPGSLRRRPTLRADLDNL